MPATARDRPVRAKRWWAVGLVWLLALVVSAPAGAGGPIVRSDDVPPVSPPPGFRDDPGRPIVVEPRGKPQRATTDRTNIVVFQLDDLPAIDDRMLERLPVIRSMFLQRGTRFRNAFVDSPLCCPSRASLLTGLTSIHHGVIDNDARLFSPSMTVATQLRAEAYFTINVGKYLNRFEKVVAKKPPGWSRTAIGSGGYFNYRVWVNARSEHHDDDPNDYSTDVFANHSLAFLRAAPTDRPIFALLSPFAVHGVSRAAGTDGFSVPAPRHRGDPRCAGIEPWDPPGYNEEDLSDKPQYVQDRPPLPYDGYPLTTMCEALLSVDQWVGRVRRELKLQGRLEDTLFVLTADNGMAWGQHRIRGKNVPYANEVPLYVRWPAMLGDAPQTLSTPVLNIDLPVTLCDVGGCTLGPYPTGQAGPDGRSWLSILLAGRGKLGRNALFHSHPLDWYLGTRIPGWYAVRTLGPPYGRWLFVAYTNGEQELYDLEQDPWLLDSEAADPDTEDLRADLTELIEDELGGPIPTPRPEPTPTPTPSPSPSPSPPP
jgi:arylsulfatase A-like enzyme